MVQIAFLQKLKENEMEKEEKKKAIKVIFGKEA